MLNEILKLVGFSESHLMIAFMITLLGGGGLLDLIADRYKSYVRNCGSRWFSWDASPCKEGIRILVQQRPWMWEKLESAWKYVSRSPGKFQRRPRCWQEDGWVETLTSKTQDDAESKAKSRTRNKWIIAIVAIVMIAIVKFEIFKPKLNDYAQGREAGIQHVREVNKKGAFIRAGMNAANILDLIPTDDKRSADWNAGFRRGFKEELTRTYPQATRR